MTNIEKVVLRTFAEWYLLCLGALLMISYFFHFRFPMLIAALIAAFLAAEKFVKVAKRAPDTEERKRLAWWSLLWSWLVVLSFAVVWLVFYAFRGGSVISLLVNVIPWGIFTIAFVVVSLFTYATTRYAYGKNAQQRAEKLFGRR